jgi:hypothetical protein
VFQAEFRKGASVAAWQQAAAARLQAGKTAAEAEAERSAASATDAELSTASLPAAARAAHAARDVVQPALGAGRFVHYTVRVRTAAPKIATGKRYQNSYRFWFQKPIPQHKLAVAFITHTFSHTPIFQGRSVYNAMYV